MLFSDHMTSKQPRKQRKRRYTLPLHKRRKQLSVRLDKKLKEQHKKRNFPVKKGDRVKVVSGKFKKKEGKITAVDLKSYKVFVEKIADKKADGTEIPFPLSPSNLMIIELDLTDPKRKNALLRK